MFLNQDHGMAMGKIDFGYDLCEDVLRGKLIPAQGI